VLREAALSRALREAALSRVLREAALSRALQNRSGVSASAVPNKAGHRRAVASAAPNNRKSKALAEKRSGL
jgi:transposase